MKALRPATSEEIAKIEAGSNLDQNCKIVALDTPKGPILFVVREAVTEVDPVHMPEGYNAHHFGAAIRDISNFLLGRGVTHFFFNLHADDASADYRTFIEKWGARRVSTAPDIRYRKNLYETPEVPASVPQD